MRDQIRNAEELGESYRRRMVLTGAWGESESRQKLKEMHAERERRHPTKKDEQRQVSQLLQQEAAVARVSNSHSMREREYYFDEGLGVSLEEHVDGLQRQFPDISVTTLRDRDGYAIVRMALKPQYKFDLDEIKSLDADSLHTANLEAQEAILEVFLPDDKKAFVEAVAAIHTNRVTDGLTQDGFEQLRALKRERLVGKFREDHAAYKQALQELKSTAAVGSISPTKLCILSLDEQRAAEEAAQAKVRSEAELFSREIHDQLRLRVRDRRDYTELQKSDLVRPARDEAALYADQVGTLQHTIDVLEKESEWLLKAKGDGETIDADEEFSLRKFSEMKATIKQRKEAKERLLQQGYADFKAYSRM